MRVTWGFVSYNKGNASASTYGVDAAVLRWKLDRPKPFSYRASASSALRRLTLFETLGNPAESVVAERRAIFSSGCENFFLRVIEVR